MTDRGHRGLRFRQAGLDTDAGNARVEMITLARATLRPGTDAEGFWSLRRPAAKAALGADAHRRDQACAPLARRAPSRGWRTSPVVFAPSAAGALAVIIGEIAAGPAPYRPPQARPPVRRAGGLELQG